MRILTLAHNHPDFHAGGTEILAWALHQHYRERAGVDAFFAAAVDELHKSPHPGTSAMAHRHRDDVALIWGQHFEPLTMSQLDMLHSHQALRELVSAWRPDVVHFHHILLLGTEAIDVVRHAAPQAKIVLTLHDFYLLCAHDGLMVKRTANSAPQKRLSTRPTLCYESEPTACNSCFPNITTWAFRRRALATNAVLEEVDQLIAPSEFLKQRFVDHGVHPDQIVVVRNGLSTVDPGDHAKANKRSPDPSSPLNLAVLGNQSPMKGTLVALEAASILKQRGFTDFHIHLYGSPALQSTDFKAQLDSAITDAGSTVTAHGSYKPDNLPHLLSGIDAVIMPSQWWENAPLVLEEAFAQDKPVICSDLGGMAERIQDGINGLHFTASDPMALANRIEQLATEGGLLNKLRKGIGPVRGIQEIAEEHLALFANLTGSATSQRTG
ncbi:MAG: glycosyltransferase family 4 protein [Alphaproteobacteria bacterium]|nr:glycosyltransferase family 4 protein [Alphaproteobacteria bacterium SS10]